ncbi:hypothetical protein Tco_0226973 [Tanacetum coccineum]
MMLLGKVPEPEDEQFRDFGHSLQLAVEESELDEPELGKAGLDESVLDKPELPQRIRSEFGQRIFIKFLLISAISSLRAAISGLEEVIELDDSLRWAKVPYHCGDSGHILDEDHSTLSGRFIKVPPLAAALIVSRCLNVNPL